MPRPFGCVPLGVGDAFSQKYYASSLLVEFEGSCLLINGAPATVLQACLSDGDCGVGGLCDLANSDVDADTVGDICDNCPTVPNTAQTNNDLDPLGDACDNCDYSTNPLQEDLEWRPQAADGVRKLSAKIENAALVGRTTSIDNNRCFAVEPSRIGR